jgi:sulfur-carrier protein
MIRVILPAHLRTLANVDREVHLEVPNPVTQRSILDALESRHPMLRGTIRDHNTQQRRPLVRFFACEEDISHDSPDAPLPDAIATGAEPFFIIGAIAGGSDGGLPIANFQWPIGGQQNRKSPRIPIGNWQSAIGNLPLPLPNPLPPSKVPDHAALAHHPHRDRPHHRRHRLRENRLRTRRIRTRRRLPPRYARGDDFALNPIRSGGHW